MANLGGKNGSAGLLFFVGVCDDFQDWVNLGDLWLRVGFLCGLEGIHLVFWVVV